MIERYINIYPKYIATSVYETEEQARAACEDLPEVRTVKLEESRPRASQERNRQTQHDSND